MRRPPRRRRRPVEAPPLAAEPRKLQRERSETYYDTKSQVFSALIDTIDLSQLAKLDPESSDKRMVKDRARGPAATGKAMPLELVEKNSGAARPVHRIAKGELEEAGLDRVALAWAREHGFSGEAGRVLFVPDKAAEVAAALFGTGKPDEARTLDAGALARSLPEGDWHFAATLRQSRRFAALGLMLGGYVFTRYGKEARQGRAFRRCRHGADAAHVGAIADGVFLARDLINTPANDMGPDALEAGGARRWRASTRQASR